MFWDVVAIQTESRTETYYCRKMEGEDGAMTDPQLSRQKLIAYIKSAKIDTTGIDNHNRYMYSLGRNTLVDVLIAGIYFGDFDEDGDKKC